MSPSIATITQSEQGSQVGPLGDFRSQEECEMIPAGNGLGFNYEEPLTTASGAILSDGSSAQLNQWCPAPLQGRQLPILPLFPIAQTQASSSSAAAIDAKVKEMTTPFLPLVPAMSAAERQLLFSRGHGRTER